MPPSVSSPHTQHPLLSKVKRLILRRGGETGIRGLSRCFRVMDDDGDHRLSEAEFKSGLEDFGLHLSDTDVRQLMQLFDSNNDGYIGITEFLTAFRVGLSPKRKAMIDRVFKIFDQNGDGRITLDELRQGYDASGHPDVLNGTRTVDEVLQDFLNCFDDKTNPDGVISKQEFEQHYSGVSARFDSDDQFVQYLRATWRLGDRLGKSTTKFDRSLGKETVRSATNYFTGLDDKMNTINPTTFTLQQKEAAVERCHAKDKTAAVIAHLRELCMKKLPAKIRGMGRELRLYDPRRTGYCETEDLHEVWHKLNIHFFISDSDMSILQQEYDTDMDGTFDYQAMLYAISGDLPPTRKLLLEKTWRLFPTDRRGTIAVEDLHDLYVPDLTPAVAKGQKSRGEELSDFLDAWHVKYSPDGRVSYTEFEEYYAGISPGIANDRHFTTMIKVSWKVWEEDAKKLVAAIS